MSCYIPSLATDFYGLQFFAFSVLLAGLAALFYWYYCYGALPPQDPHLFTVVDIDGKGKGLVAQRDIKVRFHQSCRLVSRWA
jgi:hypothetical protein